MKFSKEEMVELITLMLLSRDAGQLLPWKEGEATRDRTARHRFAVHHAQSTAEDIVDLYTTHNRD